MAVVVRQQVMAERVWDGSRHFGIYSPTQHLIPEKHYFISQIHVPATALSSSREFFLDQIGCAIQNSLGTCKGSITDSEE